MKSVLIVDDDGIVRYKVNSLLRGLDARVAQASGGQAALAKARGRVFDLVITDLVMPGMDGLALIRQLRALPAYASVPVILMTGDSLETAHGRGMDAGATVVLTKPEAGDDFIETVSRLLGV